MVVRVRFGRRPAFSRSGARNSRIATVAASLMTLMAISLVSLGLWRIGADLEWAGAFVISQGLLSHWQVWLAAAAVLQYAAWRLKKYAKAARALELESSVEESLSPVRVTANI